MPPYYVSIFLDATGVGIFEYPKHPSSATTLVGVETTIGLQEIGASEI